MDIEQIIDRIYSISESSKSLLLQNITEIDFPKNHLIIKADKIEKNIYFIKKGIARTFSFIGENEITFAFGKEGDTIISLKSYIEYKKGYENIE